MTDFRATLIIGAGQAGLALSYCLTQRSLPHLILEQAAQLAASWRTGRWDSFTLVTPNWQLRLPGAEYRDDDPDGFLTRAEIIDYLERYAASIPAPVRLGVQVDRIDRSPTGFRIQTTGGEYEAANVVVASGLFQQPKLPAFSASIPSSVTQLHSSQYRNPAQLAPGGVLVVGSGQSGCQIAEELAQSGRQVYLSLGSSSGRAPRRYRGRDCTEWLQELGFYERTVDKLPSPRAKFAGNLHVSGKDGGHTINLHQFARAGVTLLGRMVDVQAGTIRLALDLYENLAKADKVEVEIVKAIDDHIAQTGLVAPTEMLPQLHDGFATPLIRQLDLAASGITSVVWAMGYRFDFSWVRLPVLDEDGFPRQQRGVTEIPGLYFLGLPWLHTVKSGLLFGVGEDAAHVADHIAGRMTR